MAISVLERPQGVFLGDCFSATIDEDYANKATVNTTTPHNLTDGEYVYITSNIENYNGFWIVDVIDGFHFFILPYSGADPVAYIVNADITYCRQEDVHNWSCVHLPIVYKLSNDLFPTDNPGISISSFANDNGYVKITIGTGLLSHNELEWFIIDGAASEEVNGIFQVIHRESTTVYTINLAYSSTYSFSGASIRRYFMNYAMLVRIYAGIRTGHEWASIKPYEIAATLRLTPDENNECRFSINEYLKSYITTRNNLLLATLPNNTDFWCNFYIEYAESYDTSDGYTIVTTEGSYTSDKATFEGYAANAQLPFKNQYSGFMTEYVSNAQTLCKWLTNFEEPVLFPGNYFDLGIIIDRTSAVQLLRDGVVITTVNYDEGVYRFPITQGGTYKIKILGGDFSNEIEVVEDSECSNQEYYLTWLNHLGGFDYWKFNGEAEHIQNIQETGETKVNIFPEWPKSYGSDADSIRKQTYRNSNQSILLNSQHVTQAQLLAIEQIRISPLVQIVNSRTDKRTVIVDSDSFTSYKDSDKLYMISLTINFTNDNPTQRL